MQPVDSTFILELHADIGTETQAIERRYFPTLDEAMVSLLKIPIDRYQRDIPEGDGEISRILIYERKAATEQQIASTFLLPIGDAVYEGGPSAGIYLQTHDGRGYSGSIGDLEQRLSAGFYMFRHYEHDMPMVQIARATYDDRVQFKPDPALKDLVQKLEAAVVTPWQYHLEWLDGHQATPAQHFYHQQMPTAFDQLISLPYLAAAPTGRVPVPEDFPIIMIRDQIGLPLLRIYAEEPSDSAPTKQPIVMEVGMGIGRLEATAGVSLAGLEGYRHDGVRVTIGSMDTDTRNFSPAASFASLQSGLQPTASELSTVTPYTLQLEYRQLQSLKLGPAVTGATFATATFSNLEDAVATLRRIELSAFDVSAAVKSGADKYLHEATIYHSTERYDVASMFSILRDQPHVPAGIYLKINPDHLSTDTLHILHPFVKDLPHQGALLFMVQSAASQAQELRRTGGPRHFSEGNSRRI